MNMLEQLRRRKWVFPAIGAVALIIVFWAMIANRSSTDTLEQGPAPAPPLVEKKVPVKPHRRVASSRHRAPDDDISTEPPPTPLDHVRAQQLIALGYRRMQQRDFDAAHDSFQEALEIEPGNPAAQKGLKAAETAQNMQGIVGTFRNF